MFLTSFYIFINQLLQIACQIANIGSAYISCSYLYLFRITVSKSLTVNIKNSFICKMSARITLSQNISVYLDFCITVEWQKFTWPLNSLHSGHFPEFGFILCNCIKCSLFLKLQLISADNHRCRLQIAWSKDDSLIILDLIIRIKQPEKLSKHSHLESLKQLSFLLPNDKCCFSSLLIISITIRTLVGLKLTLLHRKCHSSMKNKSICWWGI